MNPRLNAEQLTNAHLILVQVREALERASSGDARILFALRRKVQKELMHDERGTPAHRNKIKRIRRDRQSGLCPVCQKELPEKYAVLDRLDAVLGYTIENTRLIHADCDYRLQAEKGYI